MTKSDIIRKLSSRYPTLYLKDVQKIVDSIFDQIGQALIEGRRVELRGFGAFSVRCRKPRLARNPRTNETVSLGERYSPYFRAGKDLRERLNNESSSF